MSTTLQLKLRDAQTADLPAIVAIYNQTVPSRMVTADTEPVSVESRVPWYQAHSPESYPLWILEVDGDTVGWLSLQAFYGRPAYKKTAELSVYIDEQYRGRGIGMLATTEAISRVKAMGFYTLLGFVFAHNLPSLALCRKVSFEQWGYLPKVAELDGKKRDLVILGKYL
jgi:L-amino acid N-acyltransferase YncA